MTLAIARRKLKLIDAVSRIEKLRFTPGNRLEQLSGNRAKKHVNVVNLD